MSIPISTKFEILSLLSQGMSITNTARCTGVSRKSVYRYLNDMALHEQYRIYNERLAYEQRVNDAIDIGAEYTEIFDADQALTKRATRLMSEVQRQRDQSRLQNKVIREQARSNEVVQSIGEQIRRVLEAHAFHNNLPITAPSDHAPVGVIQLSDVHFNELIDDIEHNSYNFEVASKRIHKLISRASSYFKAFNVDTVAVFMTGDMLNSDRRLDEITNAATNRSQAIFTSVDILQQAINDLARQFNVVVSSVTGNESRVGADIHYSDMLAGDSYDIVIHNMLTVIFKHHTKVRFIPITNPLESVVDVNGSNFLLVHGHAHKTLARTQNIENQVERVKARYASQGCTIRYVLCGHIHSAMISDLYARSSGLPGANAYSERGLNLVGRASQNAFVVWEDQSIDGIKIDLQTTDGFSGYEFDTAIASHDKSHQDVNTVVIQSVRI